MLLTRREGAADPGKIDECGGTLQIADDNGSAGCAAFPLVDENRGSFRRWRTHGEGWPRSQAGRECGASYVADCLFLDLEVQMIYKRDEV